MNDTPRPTARYRQRREAILRAAVSVLNRRGVRGMTLKDVAAQLDIVPTGVIYYFPNKEALAAACYLKAIAHYEQLIAVAATGRTPADRASMFLTGYFRWHAGMREDAADPIAAFNDVRALNDPSVNEAFVTMFRHLRDLLDDSVERVPGPLRNARVHLLLSTVFWAVVWLNRYDAEDYDRVLARTLDILLEGIKSPRRRWSPAPLPEIGRVSDEGPEGLAEQFLRAATELMNEEGYFGASVDRIAARLNLTKGALYHYVDTKDDLVVACFRQTLELMRAGQRAGSALPVDGLGRLSATAAGLVAYQLAGNAPLLRTSALTSTPEEIQTQLLAGFDRISLRFAGMVSDGIADGSLRAVDANITSDLLTGVINAAAELRFWAPGVTSETAPDLFVRALFEGLFA